MLSNFLGNQNQYFANANMQTILKSAAGTDKHPIGRFLHYVHLFPKLSGCNWQWRIAVLILVTMLPKTQHLY